MNPPDQPTPRTNAIAHRGYPEPAYIVEMTDLARILERELTSARSERDLAITRVACILWSGAIDKHTCGDVQKWADYYTAELTRLRAEVERLTAKIGNQADRIRYLEGATNHATGTPLSKAIARAEKAEAAFADPHTLHAHCLRTLTEGQIAHLFGERMTAIVNRAEKAEADNAKWQKLLLMSRDDREIDLISEIEEQARLLGMSGEREADLSGKLGRLESELAAIKHGHGELGKYEQLRLKNAELQRDKARLDWLEKNWIHWPITQNEETIREAIDAAMKGTP